MLTIFGVNALRSAVHQIINRNLGELKILSDHIISETNVRPSVLKVGESIPNGSVDNV